MAVHCIFPLVIGHYRTGNEMLEKQYTIDIHNGAAWNLTHSNLANTVRPALATFQDFHSGNDISPMAESFSCLVGLTLKHHFALVIEQCVQLSSISFVIQYSCDFFNIALLL